MFTRPVAGISFMSNITKALVPFMWVEEVRQFLFEVKNQFPLSIHYVSPADFSVKKRTKCFHLGQESLEYNKDPDR